VSTENKRAASTPQAPMTPDWPRELPPLPQYTCGQCGETFGTNCYPHDIACAYCGAILCPHCGEWFGGDS
jgi:hypothetical protein